ncbi:MAG: hypothetical protein DID90_2727552894 [Candidatus Nitrotoga sp. LAW]|nr:MAG: hypothetical protein DID90_2727552894 [Candidatus Nitrotoga sp. LAW]
MYRIILALVSIIAASTSVPASARNTPQTVTPSATSRLLSTPNITTKLLSTQNITTKLLSTQNITPSLLSTPNITPGLLSSPQVATPPIIPHTFSNPANSNQGDSIPEIYTPFISTP